MRETLSCAMVDCIRAELLEFGCSFWWFWMSIWVLMNFEFYLRPVVSFWKLKLAPPPFVVKVNRFLTDAKKSWMEAKRPLILSWIVFKWIKLSLSLRHKLLSKEAELKMKKMMCTQKRDLNLKNSFLRNIIATFGHQQNSWARWNFDVKLWSFNPFWNCKLFLQLNQRTHNQKTWAWKLLLNSCKCLNVKL